MRHSTLNLQKKKKCNSLSIGCSKSFDFDVCLLVNHSSTYVCVKGNRYNSFSNEFLIFSNIIDFDGKN